MRNKNKFRGFTVGLAVIISSAMLIISVSITSVLISDIKNALINTNSAKVYNLAETVLTCAVSMDKNIRYYGGNNSAEIEDLGGIFPKNMKIFDQTALIGNAAQASYTTPNYEASTDTFTPGYASKDYTISSPDENLYVKSSVRCLNQSLLNNLENNVRVYNPDVPPSSLSSYDEGVVTTINFSQAAVQAYSGVPNACVKLEVYAKDDNNEKLFVSTASLPCNSPSAVQRVLVQYNN